MFFFLEFWIKILFKKKKKKKFVFETIAQSSAFGPCKR